MRARREVPRPDPAITVVQAIPKGDRGELAVEEMTEVGVDRIVPWAAARCVAGVAGRARRALAGQVAGHRARGGQAVPACVDARGDRARLGRDVAAVITKAACAVVLEPDAAAGLGDLRPAGLG